MEILATCVALTALVAASPELDAAREAYEQLQFERVFRHLERAAAEPSSRADLLAILELRGLSHAITGRERAARSDFRTLLTLDPEHALPDHVAPRFHDLLDSVRGEVASAGGGLHAVDATPGTVAADSPVLELHIRNDPLAMVRAILLSYRTDDGPWRESRVAAAPLTRVPIEVPPAAAIVSHWWTLLDEHGNELLSIGSAGTSHSTGLVRPALETPPPPGAAGAGAAESAPVWQQWWLWTAVAVVVAGGVTAAVLLTRDSSCPDGFACDGF